MVSPACWTALCTVTIKERYAICVRFGHAIEQCEHCMDLLLAEPVKIETDQTHRDMLELIEAIKNIIILDFLYH